MSEKLRMNTFIYKNLNNVTLQGLLIQFGKYTGIKTAEAMSWHKSMKF